MIQVNINKHDKMPYYLQIQERIREAINKEELSPDTKLPPAGKWAPIIGVNFHTLNKALVNLAQEGLLYRRNKLGTFVSEKQSGEFTKKKSNSNLLILLPEKERLNYPYTQEVIRGINSRAPFYNMEIKVESIDKYAEENTSWKKISKKGDISGIIIDKEGFLNTKAIKIIEGYEGKIAFFNSYMPTHRDIPSVVMDNETGAYSATEYLIKRDHKKIAIILRSNPFSEPNLAYSTDSSKFEGYRIALEKYGIEIRDKYKKEGVHSNSKKIRKAVEELLNSSPIPTAILSADDFIASEVLNILNQKGIKVPEEISLIGFNNFIQSSITEPKLTTVETPTFEMGQKSVDLLFTPLDSKQTGFINNQNKHLILNVKLIERDSVSKTRRLSNGES